MTNANNPHGAFFSLMKYMPGADKADLVWSYSNGTTESLSQFLNDDPKGYNLMIRELQKRVQMEVERETKRLRSAILTRLQRHGINTTDWHDVNRFMERPQIAGKRLYDMTQDEMRALIPKLEAILKKDGDKRKKMLQVAQLN